MKIKNILINTWIINVLIVITLLILISNNVSAVTRTVCVSGCDHTTITAAETASNPYDIIDVYPGIYNENVNIDVSHLTLKGSGMDNTYIVSSATGITISATYVNISGFNISTDAAIYHDGIDILNSYANISFNKIYNVDYGIYLQSAPNILLFNNTIRKCNDYGIYLLSNSNVNITQNNFENVEYPIYLYTNGNNIIINNNWIKNALTGISILRVPTNVYIYNNYFSNNNINCEGGNINVKWNITKKLGKNIINGNYLGGNYFDNYTGVDIDDDGLGDTLLPYTDNNNILLGGDYHPLTFYIPSLSNTTYTNYTPIFNDLFKDISVWSFLIVIFGTYETFCGGNLFWLILIIIPFIMTWIKQGSVIIPSVMALICGGTLFALIPVAAIGPVKILLTIGIAGIFYHIIKSR